MQTKPLLYGLIGFFIGGLIVSIAATTFDKPAAQDVAKSGMSMTGMSSSLKNKTGDDFDKEFIASMIAHHEGAIEMARLAEENAKHDEIKNLSKDVISAQTKEIDMMRAWQEEWGYKDVHTSRPAH